MATTDDEAITLCTLLGVVIGRPGGKYWRHKLSSGSGFLVTETRHSVGAARMTKPIGPPEIGLNNMVTLKKRRELLSDDYAIALMVLHHGENPVNDITPLPLQSEDLDRKTYWINLLGPKSAGENFLASRWFRSEADAARAYCEFYGLGET